MVGVPDAGSGDMGGALDADTVDLIAQIRELAVDDPQAVQQVVAEVLAALDRVTGGAFRDRLSEGAPLGGGYGEPPARVGDLEAAAERRPGEPRS